ncbi:MAG: protein kinase [Alphaproteobacteria bacterium]|nr:protein kinase [Alphaproteobacteria bacterium]
MSHTHPILGRFQLVEPLAQGGMASVWRAVHREQGIEAAVKVLTRRFADKDKAEALRAEIRAVALLDHPRIVTIFDQGEVDARAARASGGQLKEGSPWLALELVEGGTLANLYKGLDWRTLNTVIVQLLEALAHAHAAGVIHRDIKLANVLVSSETAGIKLTDFGISYALGSHEEGEIEGAMHAGTPRYMAPEQLFGRISEQGPWTDLYAVGVLAWRMATGTTPFPDDYDEAALAKSRGELTPFHPRFPMPEGFPGWCARMMAAYPADRFTTAADALHSLRRVGPVPFADPATGPTIRAEDCSLPPAMQIRMPPPTPAPIPRDWRTPTTWQRPVELVGCGLRLFGLRGLRMVGRQQYRDQLWTTLNHVHADRRPRVVVLRGPAGYGKSSLAHWLGRRAEEVGGGVSLRTSWTDESFAGLPGLVARKLRCMTADATVVRTQIASHLRRHRDTSPLEARLLLHLLAPHEARKKGDLGELVQDERFEMVTRAITRFATERPTVVHFDDAHANPDAFAYPLTVLDRPDAPAALFLLTVQEEALAENPTAQAALAELVAHERCEVVEIGALPLEDQVDFVRGLLRLEPGLAARVARRTEGNPLFASQLLDDWVSRDLLELSVDGFRLRNPLEASLPNTLTEVWHDRVEALLEATEAHFRVPLEIAACMGSAIDIREWREICEHAGWEAPEPLVEELLDRHLASLDGDQLRFVHGMLREAILKSCARAGRMQSHHRSIADVLARSGGAAVRVGRHLLQAHAGAEAIDPLEAGAEQATANGDYNEALSLLRARTALMRQVGIPRSDERWGRGWIAQIELLARLDRWGEAETLAQQALNEARDNDWPRVEVEALMLLVENRAATDLKRARRLLDRAYEVAVQPGNEDTLAPVCLLASQVARRSGDLGKALTHAKQALSHLLSHGGLRRSRCEVEIAHTLIKLGRVHEASRHVRRAEQLAIRHENRFDAAVCAYLRASIGRERGDLDAAARGYRDATDRFSVLGDANSWAMRAHLGLVLAEKGQIDQARSLFDAVFQSQSQVGDLLAHVGSILTTSDDVDTRAFIEHFEAVKRYVQRGWCDPLVARFVEMAASRAARAGFAKRAKALLALSHHQRKRLPPPASASA